MMNCTTDRELKSFPLRAFASTLLLAFAPMGFPPHAEPPLIVHEWGTFTSFQDDDGSTIAGINVDDEPVPAFVHRLKELPVFTTQSMPALWSQGAPECHPDVTLRLETPVLYFYLPAGSTPPRLTVTATFPGGWLTEFFPQATVDAGTFPQQLTGSARGSLQWTQLELNTHAIRNAPETSSPVWLAPREVNSAVITEPVTGESEKYLFYRGVGHVDAPLVVRQHHDRIVVAGRGDTAMPMLVDAWLVNVSRQGTLHYARLSPADQATIGVPSAGGHAIHGLWEEMSRALQARGLSADEALAMLSTWKLSYFDSEGLRLLFLLPRPWTDAHLPLSLSVPADITRVMMGRIELVSAHQRQTLQQLLELPASAFPERALYYDHPEAVPELRKTASSLADLYREVGVPVPESLQLYDSLGRFRDALLANELHRATDESHRSRLKVVMDKFSACVSRAPQ